MDCPDKIFEFEEEQRKAKGVTTKEKEEEKNKEYIESVRKAGKLSARRPNFEDGKKPHTITGIASIDGEYHLTVKYDNDEDLELIPLKMLKKKWPQKLIQFLETKLVYEEEKGETSKRRESESSDNDDEGSGNESVEKTKPKPASPIKGDKSRGAKRLVEDCADSNDSESD